MAADEGALASLAASALSLCGPAGSVDTLAGLSRSTLLVVLSSITGAFGLSPARLPGRDLEHILQLLEAVFDGESGHPCVQCIQIGHNGDLPSH